LNRPANYTWPGGGPVEMFVSNTGIVATQQLHKAPCVIGGDNAGYPNGRLGDDVVVGFAARRRRCCARLPVNASQHYKECTGWWDNADGVRHKDGFPNNVLIPEHAIAWQRWFLKHVKEETS
jgi:hypothetical protein